LLFDGQRVTLYPAARIATRNDHGTGCTFASAIAAMLARDLAVDDAVRAAKEYLTAVLAASADLRLGRGPHGPMDHLALLHPEE
jgi:hydroxymethylpyrimidine/phosphomethylpyrimidine kinase